MSWSSLGTLFSNDVVAFNIFPHLQQHVVGLSRDAILYDTVAFTRERHVVFLPSAKVNTAVSASTSSALNLCGSSWYSLINSSSSSVAVERKGESEEERSG